ncbi:GAF domain-containing protein [Cellulophaga omnivescoria]|uniref:GAF domain-containing protein n=1 Tax=Cellulophaga omnivescoria TaxID=1888890 RepID=UPI0022F0D3CF|nr:GAF domain-containing protein [Cellulophaga omnivescoria]WBU90951.1 GAF domain-containing protein [Cellulophaga omnivescoria]
MKVENEIELPLKSLVSFDKLLKQYDKMAVGNDVFLAQKARFILNYQKPYPELREGFTDLNLLEKYKDVINVILQDTFSEVLTKNEIKAATLPYANVIFNSSERFKKIIEDAGEGFVLEIKNVEDRLNYIMAGTVILNFHYGFNLDFRRPMFYEIPDKNGVMRHYRILYNADFIDITPNENAKKLTQADVDELLENFDDLELWKQKIPPNSFTSKGFVISNMFDVTAEHSISEIKSSLISSDKRGSEFFMEDFQNTFKSLFGLPNLKVGFSIHNSKEDTFEKVPGIGIDSFILNKSANVNCKTALCNDSYKTILKDHNYYVISDLENYHKKAPENSLYATLAKQNIKSAIIAPISNGKELLGVLELASTKRYNLNNVNAQKLQDVMPYIVTAVLRSKAEEENLIEAVIQQECTTVHPSVLWKFENEAIRFIRANAEGLEPTFKEIVFKDVHPLYGQIDIKDSSTFRNSSIQKDLLIQLSEINKILTKAWELNKLHIYEELLFRSNSYIDEVKEILNTNSEQTILEFVKKEITPVFKHLKNTEPKIATLITAYEAGIDNNTGSYYDHRKNYDESVMKINEKLAQVLDKKQIEAQEMFPHYFERYKTDGVEHNMYIGASISETKEYNPFYLKNLRLWQLQVMYDMENEYYNLKPKLPIDLDVASLLLVYNASLSIRFRMDEKRFDVDGTYNARYEVIKKRIDKSFIKGTNERLTQKGKLSIVYSQKKDELEYLRYIRFLRSKGYFSKNIEVVELEGLQGVAGLKAIRVEILYKKDKQSKETYTYDDLMHELKR